MKKTKRIRKEKSRRGIYILPNIFTSLNLFCGFYAVIASIDGKFIAASIALFLLGLAYVISGPFNTLRKQKIIKRKTFGTGELDEHSSSSI